MRLILSLTRLLNRAASEIHTSVHSMDSRARGTIGPADVGFTFVDEEEAVHLPAGTDETPERPVWTDVLDSLRRLSCATEGILDAWSKPGHPLRSEMTWVSGVCPKSRTATGLKEDTLIWQLKLARSDEKTADFPGVGLLSVEDIVSSIQSQLKWLGDSARADEVNAALADFKTISLRMREYYEESWAEKVSKLEDPTQSKAYDISVDAELLQDKVLVFLKHFPGRKK